MVMKELPLAGPGKVDRKGLTESPADGRGLSCAGPVFIGRGFGHGLNLVPFVI